jgi:hypothetical protein
MHPSLFEGLILMDPVIQRDNPSRKYALPSTYRRDLWPSRDEARAKFQSSSFYQAWDPLVLDKWVEYGLRDLPTKLYPISEDTMHGKSAVTLTTPKAQELFTFLRSSYIDERSGLPRGVPEEEMHRDDIDDFPFYRPEPPQIFRRLPELKPAVLYLFGSDSDLSSPKARREKLVMTGTGVGAAAAYLAAVYKKLFFPVVTSSLWNACKKVPMQVLISSIPRSRLRKLELKSSRKLGAASRMMNAQLLISNGKVILVPCQRSPDFNALPALSLIWILGLPHLS